MGVCRSSKASSRSKTPTLKRIVVFDMWENDAYLLKNGLCASTTASVYALRLAAFARKTSCAMFSRSTAPEAVFHAAAHKHVPLMEVCSREVICNNAFGALNTVHFGNVLDSNESAIPVFKKRIAEGGPATVVDPNIVRFSRPSPRCRVSLFRLMIWFSAA